MPRRLLSACTVAWQGADPNAVNLNGCGLLQFAAGVGHCACALLLLASGADARHEDEDRNTPASLAAQLRPAGWERVAALCLICRDFVPVHADADLDDDDAILLGRSPAGQAGGMMPELDLGMAHSVAAPVPAPAVVARSPTAAKAAAVDGGAADSGCGPPVPATADPPAATTPHLRGGGDGGGALVLVPLGTRGAADGGDLPETLQCSMDSPERGPSVAVRRLVNVGVSVAPGECAIKDRFQSKRAFRYIRSQLFPSTFRQRLALNGILALG